MSKCNEKYLLSILLAAFATALCCVIDVIAANSREGSDAEEL